MKIIHAGLAGLSLVALAGCQGMPWQSAHRETAASSTPDMSSYFAQRLQDGRRHLAAFRLAAAIEAFRQASYHPDFAGEAYNGLGVAYDRLGRYDLAERFFRQAVTAAPEDPRFARNAARFDAAQLARAGTAQVERLAVAAPASAELPAVTVQEDLRLEELARAIGAEIGEQPAPRMARVSEREVTIASREDWTSRAGAVQSARPAIVHVGPPPSVLPEASDIQMATGAAPYPVRVALVTPGERSRFAGPQGAVNVRVTASGAGALRPPERAAYPVTVRLPRSR